MIFAVIEIYAGLILPACVMEIRRCCDTVFHDGLLDARRIAYKPVSLQMEFRIIAQFVIKCVNTLMQRIGKIGILAVTFKLTVRCP